MAPSFEITTTLLQRLSTSNLVAVSKRGFAAAAVFLVLAASPASAAIRGTVVNATTGKPAARVAVTLVRFGGSQGMAPVDEVYTDAEGKFSFDEDLQGAGSTSAHGMLRAFLQQDDCSRHASRRRHSGSL